MCEKCPPAPFKPTDFIPLLERIVGGEEVMVNWDVHMYFDRIMLMAFGYSTANRPLTVGNASVLLEILRTIED